MQYEAETELRRARSPGPSAIYSVAKNTADQMGRILAEENEIEYVSALISNIYGPGERSPRLVNSSIRKLLDGEHMAFTAGEQLYDFIYITDAAKMFCALGDEGRPGQVYYIGNRHPRPLKYFLTELRDAVRPNAPLGLGEIPFNRKGLTYHEFDTEAFYREIGFAPVISFHEGICRTRDWIVSEREKDA